MQEQLSSNSLPIATIRIVQDVPVSRSTGRARATNADRRKRQRAIQVVATHPAGELSKTIKQDVDQNVNTSSKQATAEFRFKCVSYLLRGTTKSRRPEATVGAFRRGEMTRNSHSIARNFNTAMESIGRAIRPKSQSLRVYIKKVISSETALLPITEKLRSSL